MSERPTAHSIEEVYFFLMLSPCTSCDGGPLDAEQVQRESESASFRTFQFQCRCRQCGTKHALRFPIASQDDHPHDPPVVNPDSEPSQLIDVAQWLTLFHLLTSKAAQTRDKSESRRLGYEAALCLDEALKFYEPDNELPPESAFFSDRTREHLRTQPELFVRRRLVDLRSKLPDLTVMRRLIQSNTKKPWWSFWKRD